MVSGLYKPAGREAGASAAAAKRGGKLPPAAAAVKAVERPQKMGGRTADQILFICKDQSQAAGGSTDDTGNMPFPLLFGQDSQYARKADRGYETAAGS